MMIPALLLIACLRQDPLPPKQDDIDAALKRSADWLLGCVKSGLPSDVPINGGRGLTVAPLVLYALYHAGCDPADATFKILAQDCADRKITTTYVAACTAMALNAIDSKKYKKKIWECGQFLVDNQCDNGQWSYGVAYEIPKPNFSEDSGTQSKIIIRKSKPVGLKTGDNSNSQYAALGLRACWLAGFEFDGSLIDKAIRWWEDSQKGDGSWDYGEKGATSGTQPKDPKDPKKEAPKAADGFGSMTAGGGASVAILKRIKGQTQKPAAAEKAASWLGTNWSVDENPKAPEDRKKFHYYYLYAIERMGDVIPVDRMGKHMWYYEGANWLLKQQKGGMWQGPFAGFEIADTCFAVLFLKRATKVATGDHK